MPAAIKPTMSLDVGRVRIGVALSVPGVTLARPHGFITNDSQSTQAITKLIHDNDIQTLVVGLPRGLDGQETEQTAYVKNFAHALMANLEIPVVFQDEALTSVQAEAVLSKSQKPYSKGDVDAMAAAHILQDYLEGQHTV